MSPQVTFKLITPNQDNPLEVFGEFTDDEWKVINAFIKEAEQLPKEVPFVSINTRYEDNKLSFPCELPDWNEIRIILHLLRPFYLSNESTSFYKICNMLYRGLKTDQLNIVYRNLRNIYSGKTFQSNYLIRRQLPPPNDSEYIILNSEKVLDKFLNATG